MNFEEALLEKRKGKEIRRKVWDKHVCWTAELDGLTYESVMADDWEIYEEPKWEPEGGEWFVTSSGCIATFGTFFKTRDFGIERKTEEVAKMARDKMRVFNRLLAYVNEQAPRWEPDWGKNSDNYYVYFDHGMNQSYACGSSVNERLGTVYMPEYVARKLVDDLNSGRVEL